MLEKLVIPSNTRFEERNIVASGDVIIGPNSKLSYGVIAKKILVGERASIDGDLLGEEIRLDAWCSVSGDVTSKNDAYIGEFASIGGKLTVYGDLEIGRNVRIKNGFEAKGLITIQDPTPALFFIFLYLMILLRLGRLEEAEKLLEEVEEFDSPLVIPENSQVSIDRIVTRKNAEIIGSRVLGNVRARDVYVSESEIFGSLRGREIIVDKCRVHGAIEGKVVYLVNSTEVFGHIRADKVYMEDGCSVEGGIVGREGVWIKERVELPGMDEEASETEDVEERAGENTELGESENTTEGSEEPVIDESGAKEEEEDGVEKGEVQKDVS
ncbi:acyltransferase [Archaeoglobus neptunius]|uniref:acyltransferase n=1 Tax=Archaeoglobus neptunius TaxID=2798580 RepID=UPI001926DFFB|nr:acyltransferase [Archaeoglobus neptunius]